MFVTVLNTLFFRAFDNISSKKKQEPGSISKMHSFLKRLMVPWAIGLQLVIPLQVRVLRTATKQMYLITQMNLAMYGPLQQELT